jgi:AcrR family transcriptional regulator
VEAAVRAASLEGLEGLTIGRLADDLEMSKSGLFGLFGSKLDLQLATLQAANELFLEEVWRPVRSVPAGRARLLALCDSWLSFHERCVLPGGCFTTTAAVEWDARPGPLRDAVAESLDDWLKLLSREVSTAVEQGELPKTVDPADAAFQLNALASAASWTFHLTGERGALKRARRCMEGVLAG